ncbi:hypothetical protein, partial [Mycolicibacterium duvalii]
GSNSPNKNVQNKFDQTKDTKTGIKKTAPLNGKKKHGKKQQQIKTTKHTIEFSNNTPGFQATLPLYCIWPGRSNLVRRIFRPGAVGFCREILRAVGQTPKLPA